MIRTTTAMFGLALWLICVASPARADGLPPDGGSKKSDPGMPIAPPLPPVNILQPRPQGLGHNPIPPPPDIRSPFTIPPAGTGLDGLLGKPTLGGEATRHLPEFSPIHDSGASRSVAIEHSSQDRWIFDNDLALTSIIPRS
jgi:hypothetical protein